MKYVITYKGDIVDKIQPQKSSSHWLNTDGNTVQEISRDLGELSPSERLFAIAKMTSLVTACARKNGQILLMETDPSKSTGEEGK